MCIETHTRHRRCTHTRFLRWDYCSILIPTDRLPTTGRLCRRYKLRFQDAKKSEECVECARERVVASHTPMNTPTTATFPAMHSPMFRENPLGWLNTPVSDPVPVAMSYGALPTTSAHANSSTWGALSALGSGSEVARVPKEKEATITTLPPTLLPPAPAHPSVYGQGCYAPIASEEVQTERMTLAELLGTPPSSSFAESVSAAKAFVPARVKMRGGGEDDKRKYSAFPAPMRGNERQSGWKAPESWGVGGSQEGRGGEEKENEAGGEVEGKRKRWYKELFKYREGYSGGAF
jgi:hypothetical protein